MDPIGGNPQCPIKYFKFRAIRFINYKAVYIPVRDWKQWRSRSMSVQPGIGESCWEIACIECQRLANLRLSLVSILPAEPYSWRNVQILHINRYSSKKRQGNQEYTLQYMRPPDLLLIMKRLQIAVCAIRKEGGVEIKKVSCISCREKSQSASTFLN